MLGVVSGAKVIQDIPVYFESLGIEYDNTHRNLKETHESYRDYFFHRVIVTDTESKMYEAFSVDVIEGAPSWHHQAILSVEGTNLKITGSTFTCGVEMIEAVEYTGKSFIAGLQFHPEAGVVKHLINANNADSFMSLKEAEKIFSLFASYCFTL